MGSTKKQIVTAVRRSIDALKYFKKGQIVWYRKRYFKIREESGYKFLMISTDNKTYYWYLQSKKKGDGAYLELLEAMDDIGK